MLFNETVTIYFLLVYDSMQVVDKMVGEAHTSAHNQTIYLNIITPPVFETVRIACRTIVTNSPIKLGPFPCWDELLSRLIGKILEKKHLICNDIEDAKVKVSLLIILQLSTSCNIVLISF